MQNAISRAESPKPARQGYRRYITYFMIGTSLSACTTSLTVREDTATASRAAAGIPYRLPEKSLSLEVTWTVSDCPIVAGLNAATQDIGFETSATLASTIIEGPSLVIDYTRMTNRFKTGSFTAEYYVNEDKSSTRIIKSINASIKGEEPAALKSAISSITKIAKLALGLPSGAVGASPSVTKGKQSSPCNDTTRENLAALKEHEKEIKAETEKAEKLSARMAVLQSRLVGGELTAADKAEAEKIFKELDTISASIDMRKDAAKTLKSRLRYSEKFDVDASGIADKTFVPNEAKFKKWLATLVPELNAESSINAYVQASQLKKFEIKVSISAVPERYVAGRTTPITIERQEQEIAEEDVERATRSWPGYVYRDPGNYKIVVTSATGEELVKQTERMPQLGKLRVLPLRSRWGEHNTLSADFAPDGLPTKVTYTTPVASGVAMFEALDDATGGALEVSDLLAAQKAARKSEKEGAAAKALAELKVEVDTLEQRKKLLELQNGPPQEIADINAELVLLRLQKERAELQAAIRNAQPVTDD